jgi:hypothetical protein
MNGPKLTRCQLADEVEKDGLDYAILSYCGAEYVADPELAFLWDLANRVLTRITRLLER